MLYERWRQIARACPDRTALRDLAGGGAWTFRELQSSAENGTAAPGPIAFPQGTSAEFIFTLLRAWHAEQVVCPLEPGQTGPVISGPLPSGVTHLKSTSATTGPPRLVAFTAEQLIADVRNIVVTMGLNPEWPNLGVISLAHSYGFSNLVLPLLLHGVPLVLLDSPLPESVRQAGTLFPHLTLAAGPALWRAWPEVGAIPKNVRVALSGG